VKLERIKKLSLKTYAIALIIAFFVGLVLGGAIVYSQSSNENITIVSGSFTETASYIIFRQGDTYYAKNGTTGVIEFSGTDAASVIQQAIDAINGKGHIFIKSGIYNCYTPITYNSESFELYIEGEAAGLYPKTTLGTVLRKCFDGDLLTLTSSNYNPKANFRLEKLRFDGQRDYYTGRLVVINGPSWSVIKDCVFRDSYGNAIRIEKSKVIRLVRCQVYFVQTESGVYLNKVADSQIYDLEVCIGGGEGWGHTQSTGIALEIDEGCGLEIFGGHFEGYYGIKTSSQITVIGAHFSLSWSNNVYIGFAGCSFIGCYFFNPNNGGFSDQKGANILTISPNVRIIGCYINSGGKATYGYYGYGSSESLIAHNDFYGTFSISPIRFVGGEIYRDNIRVKTENSGTATISSSTSVTFEHGLAGTPTHVEVGWKDTGYGDWKWTANATHITITVTNSGTYSFSWRAYYKP